MNAQRIVLALATCLALLQSSSSLAASQSKSEFEQQRVQIRSMARETIEHLYRVEPRSRKALAGAAGYAVFSNFGMKLFVGGGGSGSGVAFSRDVSKLVFMKMVEMQAGIGFRFSKYRQIWVFEHPAELKAFINSGSEFGGQTTLSAKLNSAGADVFAGAMSVRPGVWVYVLSDDGLAADLTIKGAKYYPNKALN